MTWTNPKSDSVLGRRRNIPDSVIAAYVFLSRFASVGYALSMFLIAILFTPASLHDAERKRMDATFTPRPVVYCGPILFFAASVLGAVIIKYERPVSWTALDSNKQSSSVVA